MNIRNTCYRLVKAILLLILVLLNSACKRNPTGPSGKAFLLTSSSYHDVILKIIDYDVVQITHVTGLDLRSATVARVVVGSKDSTRFIQLLSVPSTYDPNANAFIVHYDFTVTMDQSKVQAPLTIRYYQPDSSFIDADTSINLLQFPYPSAQVLVTHSIFPYPGDFQDIDRVGNILYFHGIGQDALHSYDLNSHKSTVLYEYISGDHIAADSSYVYCDVNHVQIDRYNVATGTVDRSFLYFSPAEIFGMALSNQFLYVLVGDPTNVLTLKKYTLNASQVDSVLYAKPTTFMTIYDSVVYAVDWRTLYPYQISRFDLRTNTFLPNLLAPAKSCSGIRVFGTQLLFCDDWKRLVATVPIADLAPAHTSSPRTSGFVQRHRAPNQSLPPQRRRAGPPNRH